MPRHAFNLFGKNTLELLPISYGTLCRQSWQLNQHPGPTVHSRFMGCTPDKILYLYPHHLSLLYERFSQANPEGAVIEINDTFEMKWTPPNLSPADVEELHERRKIFVDLLCDEGDGYPHLRKYLPEIFQGQVIEEMARDPWLDSSLLADARKREVVSSLFEDKLTEHPRWSKEWADYCKGLTS